MKARVTALLMLLASCGSETTVFDTTPPSVPINLEVSETTGTSVTITWTASQDPESGIAGYNVYRDAVAISSPTATSYVDRDLTPNTDYAYTVSSVNGDDLESEQSDPVNATTLDATVPSTPTDLAATTITSNSVTLAWTASQDPESGVAHYNVYRNSVIVANPTEVSHIDSLLTGQTQYAYTVSAVNGDGFESDQTPVLNVTTLTPPDSTPPTVPTNVVASEVTETTVTLTWDASQDTETGVSNYNVYRDGVVVGTPTELMYTDSGLTGATQYAYSLSAVNGDGLESDQSPSVDVVTVEPTDTTPPSAPTGLQSSDITSASIRLTWMSSEDSESGVSNYNLYRDGSIVASPTDTTHVDTGLDPNTQYVYTVSAVNGEGLESDQSAQEIVVTINEFVCDAVSPGRCLFVSATGNDTLPGTIDDPFQTFRAARDALQKGDIVYVREGVYSSTGGEDAILDLDIDRFFPTIDAAAGDRIIFRAFPGETPVLDGLDALDDAMYIRRSGVVIDGFVIRNLTGTGISIWGESHIEIVNNYIYNVVGPGESNRGAVKLINFPSFIEIAHNTLQDVWATDPGDDRNAAGIMIFDGGDYSFHHNLFVFTASRAGRPRGIYQKAGRTTGPQEIYNNLFINVPGTAYKTAGSDGHFHHNLMVGHENNLDFGGAIGDASRNVIEFNTFVSEAKAVLEQSAQGGVDNTIQFNIVYQENNEMDIEGQTIWVDGFGTAEDYQALRGGYTWDNNCYFNPLTAMQVSFWGQNGGLYTGLAEWQMGEGYDLSSFETDPLFVADTRDIDGDYHPQAAECEDKGVYAGSSTFDVNTIGSGHSIVILP